MLPLVYPARITMSLTVPAPLDLSTAPILMSPGRPPHRPRLAGPTYDRTALTPAIVHLGVGGFHRAHQAAYLDALARQGVTDWGEIGVGLRHRDMLEALQPQNYLYTLVERDAEADNARVIGVIRQYLFAPERQEAVLAALTDPRTRLVTLTITMAGYAIDPVTGELQAHDPEIQADLRHPDRPTTMFGYLCEALDRRRRAGQGPFTILSCDNMQDNGGAARTAIQAFARMRDPALGQWIEDNVAFPSCMVDRITPETTDDGRRLVAECFGMRDRWPVLTEPFSQWIIEDTFCDARPPLEDVGVQFVSDVTPYLTMKTRLLNASHSALGYLGSLAGYRYTNDAIGDPLLSSYIERVMDAEVTPLLPPLPGIHLSTYKRTLLRRFGNPRVKDELARLCARGSTKMPTFLLPSITEALEQGRNIDLLTLSVAGWFRYLRGVDFEGQPIDVKDALKDQLQTLALMGGNDPRPLLTESRIFGDLGRNGTFVDSLRRALRLLDERGLRSTIELFLNQGSPLTSLAAARVMTTDPLAQVAQVAQECAA
jgi:mannitol 2-dehydrogenase